VLFNEVDLHYRSLSQVEKVARDLLNSAKGTLRLAATSSLAAHFLPDVVAEFLEAYPGYVVSVSTFHSMTILERVALHQFELGIVQVTGDYPGVNLMRLPTVHAVCILPMDHPLTQNEIITPELIGSTPFVSLGRTSPLRRRIDVLFDEHGVDRNLRVESSLAASVCGIVARGVGVAIVDPFVVLSTAKEFEIRRFSPPLPFDAAVIMPNAGNKSIQVMELRKIMKRQFRNQKRVVF
jgi:DNA-binding transcriptional LysR family regulator